jgi:hypothetical protein
VEDSELRRDVGGATMIRATPLPALPLPQAERDPFDIEALLEEKSGRDGTVHTTAHRHDHFLSVSHQLSAISCQLSAFRFRFSILAEC